MNIRGSFSQDSRSRIFFDIAKGLLIFIVYFLTAYLGLQFDAVSGFAALVWPPTGIAIASIFLFGYRFFPSILVGAFLINYLTGAPIPVAFMIGVGNTLEAVVGVYVLRKFGFKGTFDRVGEVLSFIFFGALLNSVISATIGVSSLWVGGIVPASVYLKTWGAWWMGDVLGALVVGSFILISAACWGYRTDKYKVLEWGLIISTTVFVCSFIFLNIFHPAFEFAGSLPIGFLAFPLLIIAALRKGIFTSACVVLVTAVIAVIGVIIGDGPFAAEMLTNGLFLTQLFVGTVATTGLVLSTIETERRKTLVHLHELDRAKSEFLALASHQLRTPLAIIQLHLDLLNDPNTSTNITDEQRESLKEIEDSSKRTAGLINGLLNVSRIELGIHSFKPQSMRIKETVQEMVNEMRPKAGAKNLQLQEAYEDIDHCIMMHPDLMKIILENLLSNSIKYSPVGASIRIGVQSDKEHVVIYVVDQGYGIPKQQQDRVFTKLFRGKNVKNIESEGSGLGLYLTKTIVDTMGGKILFESGPGGTTFYVSFPHAVEKQPY